MSALRFLDFPPHIQTKIWKHAHANSTFAHLPFPYPPQRAPRPPLTTFHLFPRLPRELQAYIWKLAFLRNTTYNSDHHRWALTTFVHTSFDDRQHPSGEYSIYAPPCPGIPITESNWRCEIAEEKIAFWMDSNDGSGGRLYLHLLQPAESDTRINLGSGIPALLEACYLSRKVTLAIFKEVLVSFQQPGYRTPWPHMLRAIQHSQNMQVHSTFPHFALLPPHLQGRIWKFAFLLNTTYNTSRCRNALAIYGIPEESNDKNGNGFCNIYGTDRYASERFVMHNWKTRRAEVMTAFWTYMNCPPGFESRSARICLAYPPLEDECPLEKPPPFLILPDGTRVQKKEKRDGGEYITKTSRIPQLLQTCSLSRQVSLETWREVLTAYQLEGYRVPWGNMLAAIGWNLHLFHQANNKTVSEVEGGQRMDDKKVSLKRKQEVVEEEETLEG